MPFPVLLPVVGTLATALRIPMLAAFLGGIFSSLITWFAKFFTKKIAYQLAIVASILSVTAAFSATIYGIYATIRAVAPYGTACGMSLIVPFNAVPCVSAVMSAKVIRWVYEWKITFISDYKNFLT
jgi:hypothetical protein